MAAAKHTPGPWRVAHDVHGRKREHIMAAGVRVATVGDDVQEPAANARLIAAAPDLLEALRGALKRILPIDPRNPLHDPEYVAARAAIAKATRAALQDAEREAVRP